MNAGSFSPKIRNKERMSALTIFVQPYTTGLVIDD